MEAHIHYMPSTPKGMRAIDLDFIQKLIRSMKPSEEGKLHTHMVSDDYCKRALIGGLSPFVVIDTPDKAFLVLTDISSLYHAYIYYESLAHFNVISLLCDDPLELAGLYQKVIKLGPIVVAPELKKTVLVDEHPVVNNFKYGKWIHQAPAMTIVHSEYGNNFCIYRHSAHVQALADYDASQDVIVIDLGKEYEQPITSISADGPGIKL